MKIAIISALALAGHGFDFGAFFQDAVHNLLPSTDMAAGKNGYLVKNATVLVPKFHAYAPNIFDGKFNFTVQNTSLDSENARPINETEFNLVSAIINTFVVVDFNRKKLLPLDLVDRELPLNPQTFSSIRVRMQQPNVEQAQLMKLYSASAYCRKSNLTEWSCGENCAGLTTGTRLVKYLTNAREETAGFVALNEREKMIVVSYRGSSNLNNWINNAMVILVPFDLAEVKNCSIKNRLLVHRGFQIMARSLFTQTRSTVVSLLAQYKDYKVAITGHSAGGAIATLVTVGLGASGAVKYKDMTLVTFGQPRVGDAAFTTYMNSQPLTAARVTNGVDPVNILPTQEMGFHHQHTEFFLTRINGVDKLKTCLSTSHTESPECARFDILPKRLNGHYEYFGHLNTKCN
ncbi:hypothetical protein DSO57_1029117 [Entomophthora muscae]|uniref:Uncharacterized protein n=1 Tax=Entomophthora muscae TaxID=34485 RepID=A0ACC2SEC8_9FUNG|nr:hypothetical protein DSO57_1029117 [Entomophthora muscae]